MPTAGVHDIPGAFAFSSIQRRFSKSGSLAPLAFDGSEDGLRRASNYACGRLAG